MAIEMRAVHAVTGAFGFSGRYIARRLLDEGVSVRTLTNSPGRSSPLKDRIEVFPYNFGDHSKMAASLSGVDVFYNTYWVRFSRKDFSHSEAVLNTLALFRACKEAGVKRIVHTSITNPSEDSDLEYFSGKAKLEKALSETGIPYSILRPAVLFGEEDILVNNIAWMLRRLPVIGLFGKGDYRLRPIHVDDFAALAVDEGKEKGNRTIDAVGPETFTYRGLVEALRDILGVRRMIIPVDPDIAYLFSVASGWFLGDVVLTKEEIKGLMRGLLCTGSPPAGKTSLTGWAEQNKDTLGRRYHSELKRRRDRTRAYGEL